MRPDMNSRRTASCLGRMLASLAFVLPFVWFPGAEDPAQIPRYAVIHLGLGFLILILVYRLPEHGLRAILSFLPVRLCILYLIWALLCNIWAVSNADAIVHSVNLIAMVTLFVLAVYVARYAAYRVIITIVRWGLVAAAVVAVIGLAQNAGLLKDVFTQTVAPAATMVHRNLLGHYLDCLIFPALYFLLTSARRWAIGLYSLIFALLLAMLVLTFSRGALLGMTVGFGVLTWYVVNRRLRQGASLNIQGIPRWKFLMLGISILCAGLVILSPSPTSKDTLSLKIKDTISPSPSGNIPYRLALYENSWELLRNNPQGIGLGNWRVRYAEVHQLRRTTPYYNEKYQTKELHNDVYAVFVETGIIGGILFLATFVSILYEFFRRKIYKKGASSLAFYLVLSLIVVWVHSLVSFPFHNATASFFIWLWAGLITGISHRSGRQYKHPITSMGLRQPYIGYQLLVFILIAGTAVYDWRYIAADRIQVAAQQAFRTDCPTALKRIDQAYQSFPYHYRVRQRRAIFHYTCDPNRQRSLDITLKLMAQEPYYLNNLINLLPLADELRRFDLIQEGAIRLLQAYPALPIGYHAIGMFFTRQGKLSDAISWFALALEHDQDYQPSFDMIKELKR